MLRQLLKFFISMHENREGESRCKELPGLLLSYTRQVAMGMVCLQMKQFIHRDLAARNVLVFEDGLCKVRIYYAIIVHIVWSM